MKALKTVLIVIGLAVLAGTVSAHRSPLWFDTFPTTSLDASKWTVISGAPSINTSGGSEPSPPYSLNLDETDAVETKAINLTGKHSVVLSLYYQNSATERGDDLVIRVFYDGYWIELKRYPGEIETGSSHYLHDTVAIPPFAYAADFKFMLVTECDNYNDDWFVDDIGLYLSPDITVSPDSFSVPLDMGGSTTRTMTIGNEEGEGDLTFNLVVTYGIGGLRSNASVITVPVFSGSEKVAGFDHRARTTRGIYSERPSIALGDPGDVISYFDVPAGIVNPWGIGWNGDNGYLLVSDTDPPEENHYVSPAGVLLRTISTPWVSSFGADAAYYSDHFYQVNVGGNNAIYKLDLDGSVVDFMTDPDGIWSAESQRGLAVHASSGDLFVGGWNDDIVYRIKVFDSPERGRIVYSFPFPAVAGLAWHPGTQTLWISDNAQDDQIFEVDPVSGAILRQFSAPGTGDYCGAGLEINSDGNLWYVNQEEDRIYLIETGSPLKTWLTVSPTSGEVPPGSTVDIALDFDATDLTPDSIYHASVIVNSDDPDEPSIPIPVHLTVNPVDYYMKLDHAPEDSIGARGDTLAYHVTVKNLGSLADMYDLSVSGNVWPTSIWDASGSNVIAHTGTIASHSSESILVRVVIPVDAEYYSVDSVTLTATSTSDASVTDAIVLTSCVSKPADELPFEEDFETTVLNDILWPQMTGTPTVNTDGENEPSPPFSLELNGTESISSLQLKLHDKADVRLEYYHQNNATETGDDLVVKCYTPGYWVELARHSGEQAELTDYQKNRLVIPAFALTDSFKIRFESTSDNSGDEWFVDNIRVYVPPTITVTAIPSPMDFALDQGDSTFGDLILENSGESNLELSLRFVGTRGGGGGLSARIGRDAPGIFSGGGSPFMDGPEERAIRRAQSSSRRILAWTGYTDYDQEYANTLDAISEYFTDYTLSETSASDASTIASLLSSHDVFLIPEQESTSSSTLSSLGSAWSSGLASFVHSGGMVVALSDVYSLLNSADLLACLDKGSTSSASLRVVEPEHPLAEGVHPTFSAENATRYYSSSDATEIVEVTSSGYSVVLAKEVGFGAVVLIGCDFYNYNDDFARLLANAVQWRGGAFSNWLRFSSTSEVLRPGGRADIHVTIRSQGLLPDSTYYGAIIIESNAVSSPDTVSVSLTVNARPYYFELDKTTEHLSGIPGQTLQSRFTITNRGKNSDSYSFDVSGNAWPTTIWDESGASQVSTTPAIGPKGSYVFVTKVEIPGSEFFGTADSVSVQIQSQGDPLLKCFCTVLSASGWSDRFETVSIDTTRWTVVSGAPEVTSDGQNEPSEPYSLELHGSAAIESKMMDLTGFADTGLSVSFWWQNYGTETGDDLVFRVFQGTYWIELLRLDGELDEHSTYTPQRIEIPEFALASSFKFQFRSECDYDGDVWFIDDVSIEMLTGVEEDALSRVPVGFELSQNYPNPFNPATTIQYSLPHGERRTEGGGRTTTSHVSLKIYNILGQEVRTLVDEEKEPGTHTVVWDGRDDRGGEISTGVYFYRMSVDGGQWAVTRRMVFMK